MNPIKNVELKQQVDELLHKGFIKEFESLYSSELLAHEEGS